MTGPQGLIWNDGVVVPFESATVHVLAHSMQRGATVFDVLRVVEVEENPHAFGLRPHVARFLRSMELMGMERPFSVGQLETAVATTVLANPGSGTVKLVAAWAEVAPKHLPVSMTPSVWVTTAPPSENVEPAPPALRVKTALGYKMPADLLPPNLKVSAGYTVGIRERLLARTEGFDDVIFRTAQGDMAEGTTRSSFVVSGGRILVPPLDAVLDGITRRAVLDLAYDMGINVEIRPVAWDEVLSADEVFMSSTTEPVLPVSHIDDHEFAPSGPITSQLQHAMGRLLDGSHKLSPRWLLDLVPLAKP